MKKPLELPPRAANTPGDLFDVRSHFDFAFDDLQSFAQCGIARDLVSAGPLPIRRVSDSILEQDAAHGIRNMAFLERRNE